MKSTFNTGANAPASVRLADRLARIDLRRGRLPRRRQSQALRASNPVSPSFGLSALQDALQAPRRAGAVGDPPPDYSGLTALPALAVGRLPKKEFFGSLLTKGECTR
jgi:hypothetical protein